jgi:hypothetical protein
MKQHRPTRAFQGVRPIEIYRVAGRRPSSVWVDPEGRIAAPGPHAEPLKERVYWRTSTGPGEQIQEHTGGMYLVTPDGNTHPIVLSPPKELAPETAFSHALASRIEDGARIEELLAAGDLVQVEARRPKGQSSRPADRLVPATHPLVIEDRPEDIDAMPSRRPQAMAQPRRWR